VAFKVRDPETKPDDTVAVFQRTLFDVTEEKEDLSSPGFDFF
jgi:hypothetical protein